MLATSTFRFIVIGLAWLMLVTVGSLSALAQTILRVDASSTATTPNGTTWALSYPKLQDAIAQAGTLTPPVEVWVADGTYYPDEGAGITDNDPTVSFELKQGVAIYGGFAGSPTNETSLNQRNPLVNVVILNGDLAKNDTSTPWQNYGDNALHVVSANSVNDTAILDGVTVRGGSAGFTGGGVWTNNSSARIIGCRIIDNQASGQGGGVGHEGSASPPPELRLCEISRNRTTSASGQGGAVAVSSSADLVGCRMSGNTADAGGAIVIGTGTTNVYHCILSNNSAVRVGGGIYASGSSASFLSVANTLIAQNHAPEAGGVYTGAQIDAEILDCTVADNTATSGGGLFIGSSGDTTIANCIFWGNTASTGAQIYNPATNPLSVTYSDVQGGIAGTGNMNLNPQFVSGNVYALSCGSPCRDAGLDSAISADTVDVDEDSNVGEDSPFDVVARPREVDTVPSTSSDVDMGAYEGQGENGCAGDTDHSGVVDVDDLVAVILHWGACGSPASGCFGDVFTHPCGDGTVNIDDLVTVILNWGPCPTGFIFNDSGPLPEELQECLDACEKKHGYGTSEWYECVQGCALGF